MSLQIRFATGMSARLPGCCFALAVAALAFVTGCGESNPTTGAVTGKVTYKGKPVSNGLIQFVPQGDGNAATGEITPDGTYELTTYVKGDGARPGSYKVSVQVFPTEEEGAGLPGAEFAGKKPPIPPKYNSADTSGLSADVKEGENKLDFDLK